MLTVTDTYVSLGGTKILYAPARAGRERHYEETFKEIFKEYSLLWYTGSISNIEGDAVSNFDPETGTAVIDMSYDDGTGLAGVPVTLTFSFNMTPPGMSNSMEARFICE